MNTAHRFAGNETGRPKGARRGRDMDGAHQRSYRDAQQICSQALRESSPEREHLVCTTSTRRTEETLK
jgi:hypothetical protein